VSGLANNQPIQISSGLGDGGCFPGNINFPVLGNAVPEIEIDQALIGHPGFVSHLLEIGDNPKTAQ
jgi:hypothetical protein